MDIHKLDRDHLKFEYGLFGQRLLPWPELNAPFEGMWCVIQPGTASTAHSHDEYEIFIAVSGQAVLEFDGERRTFAAGDIAYLRPGGRHQVINDGDTDFQYYGIWWDAEMTERFTTRHETARHETARHETARHEAVT